MARSCAVVFILLLLFCATGCIEIEVTTKLEDNGSGTQTWRFAGTALVSSEIKKQVENNSFFKSAVIRDAFEDGDYILEATLKFQDVKDLENADREIRYETEGYFVRTHTYSEVWKRSGQESGMLAQHARGAIPITFRVQVMLPGRIVQSNADSTEGSVARWSVPASDLVTSKMLVARSRSWNWTLLIPAAVIAGGLFIGVCILVFRSVRKTRSSPVALTECTACGAKVSADSVYCNFCGKSMKDEQTSSEN
jgi:hypothetical protein